MRIERERNRNISILRMLKKSFSYRVIRAFLLVLVLVYLLYFGIFQAGYHMLTEEISQSLYTKTSFMINAMEEEIGRIQKLQNECLNDDILYYTIGAFSIMTDSEKTKKLLDIQDRLSILHESSTYIDEVFVYIPAIERRISSMDGVETVGSGEKQTLLDMQEKLAESPLFYDQGAMYLGAAYPYSIAGMQNSRMFILVIRLSEEELETELNFLNEYQGSGVKLRDCGGEYELNVGKNLELEGLKITGESLQRMRDRTDHRKYTIFAIHSMPLEMDLFAYIPNRTIYSQLRIYQNIFFGCLTIVVILMACYLYVIYAMISSPIKTLVTNLEQMETGDLNVRIRERREDEFGYVYIAFNRMAESLQNQMEINYKQKLLTQQSQLKYLQSQINPHFLYNSFFSMYRMAKDEDYESIVEFSSYLSEYYRYITKSAENDVELRMETEHAERYARIQEMRFKRRLRVTVEKLPNRYEKLVVPRLILQPLLENAFEHGLNNVEKGGFLHIWYEAKENRLLIHVQDNGAGMDEEKLDEMRRHFAQRGEAVENALYNINSRLKIRFGNAYGIEIESREGQGTLCSLVLPADVSEENVPGERRSDVQGIGCG